MLVNMNEILKAAQAGHYAVGQFNTIDTDMLEAAISAAEELRSPLIVGTAEVLLPYGELSLTGAAFVEAAKRASVPVAVHYDHGVTFDRCMEALRLGYSSVMFDGSAKSVAENMAQTAQIVKIAHAFGASVEGEIGHVGQAANDDGMLRDMYTTPEEAVDFVTNTGVDALAVAIGSAHGVYKSKPSLDIQRLKEIRGALDTPLVLHGGSGLSDEDFRNCVSAGIAKINIYTDLCIAGCKAMEEGIAAGKHYMEIRNLRVEAIKQVVKRKMELFGSVNRA